MEGWVKFNSEGAAKENPGLAGAEGVFRNNQGLILGIHAKCSVLGALVQGELQ